MSDIPPGFLPGPAPPDPPADWEKRLKFQNLLNYQNPMMTMTPVEAKQVITDEEKKKKRKEEIKRLNQKKKKSTGSKTSIASGDGTVTPVLYDYSSLSPAESTGGGFSLSDVPSIVWIILAVGVGIFLIKSARKR